MYGSASVRVLYQLLVQLKARCCKEVTLLGRVVYLMGVVGVKGLLKGIVAVAILMVTLLLPAISDGSQLRGGSLVVAADFTLPPYDYMVDGARAGFDFEMVTAIAGYLNKKIKFLDARLDYLAAHLSSSSYDIAVSALRVTPERIRTAGFIPYAMAGESLVVLSESQFKLKDLSDLCGRRVATVQHAARLADLSRASTVCEYSGNQPITVGTFPTSRAAASALLAGGFDVFYVDSLGARQLAKQSTGRLSIASNAILNPRVCGIFLGKRNLSLKADIAEALVYIKSSGKYAYLLNKYGLDEPTIEATQAAVNSVSP